ncbi:MAG: amidohydrolase family protein, partial [Bacteroidetes bacterium]|nr:amidohydrolase family protein [Bacteroidota bacterium]
MKKLLFLIAVFLFQNGIAQRTIIYCGKLIDVKALQEQSEMSIVVEGNKITDIQKGYIKAAATDKVIDLKNNTVMPGLIDSHVHLEDETSPHAFADKFRLNEADIAFQSTVYAERTLMAGFTTVRDVGGSGVNIALRKAINKGIVKGPRILTAGKIIASTGGHADPTTGLNEDFIGDPGP